MDVQKNGHRRTIRVAVLSFSLYIVPRSIVGWCQGVIGAGGRGREGGQLKRKEGKGGGKCLDALPCSNGRRGLCAIDHTELVDGSREPCLPTHRVPERTIFKEAKMMKSKSANGKISTETATKVLRFNAIAETSTDYQTDRGIECPQASTLRTCPHTTA